jgi:tellurite resistance protein TerC
VLFWGILGALLMRGIMIAVGATLIVQFHWILYVFAALLILTAVKMLFLDHRGPRLFGTPWWRVLARASG